MLQSKSNTITLAITITSKLISLRLLSRANVGGMKSLSWVKETRNEEVLPNSPDGTCRREIQSLYLYVVRRSPNHYSDGGEHSVLDARRRTNSNCQLTRE